MGDIAVGIFQETLEQLIVSSDVKSIRKEECQLRSLQEDIKYMRGFLKIMEKKRYEHSEVMNLVTQIKDVVFEAENIIELFIVKAVKALDANQHRPVLHLGSVIKKIKTLTAKIKNIYDENMLNIKGVAGQRLEHSFSKSEEGSRSSGKSNTSKVAEEKVVVGFKEEVDKLLGILHGNVKDGALEIISIVGAAGGGKTTLAREVYEHPLTSATFAIRAWLTVSQDYDKTKKREMLIPILESAYPEKNEDYRMRGESYDLGEETYKGLKGKKYLIVMDDIWDTEAWDDIQRSLPRECSGSKVLFTSRLLVQPNGIQCFDPHHLAPLPKHCSLELLQKKVFGKISCPTELAGICEHIAEKCEGLPLAIVTVAGILAMEEKTVGIWEKVFNSLSSIIAESQDGCMKILEVSYNHLPLHLKACFIYIGGFPEDSEIVVRELIWLWIAEGFIQQNEGDKSLEDIAKDYLCNLIDRNLIMEDRKRPFGVIKACRIHDLLRELCLKKAKEDNFLMQFYGDHTFSRSAATKLQHRRLFIGSQSFCESSLRHCSRNLRSFLCLCLKNFNELGFEPDLSFFVKEFELLRVLYFESILDCGGKVGRGDLIHLRYLALKTPERAWNFVVPSYLFNLETLYIKRPLRSYGRKHLLLPPDIFKMVKLRHLYAKEGIFNYHHNCLDRLSKLDNLQTLDPICPCEVCINFLVRSPNLRKLGFHKPLGYDDSVKGDLMSLDLGFLKCLENVKIVRNFWERRLPPVLKFPLTVTRLSLDSTYLKWEELSILQTALPNLEVLKLLFWACDGPTWNTIELEGFSKLKYLRLQQLDIEEWIASEEQFPRLEVLEVRSCKILKGIPIDFANLNELHEIEVSRSSLSAEESAKEIEEERRNTRGNDGCINLILLSNLGQGDDDSGDNHSGEDVDSIGGSHDPESNY